jgi:hypothetical protein
MVILVVAVLIFSMLIYLFVMSAQELPADTTTAEEGGEDAAAGAGTGTAGAGTTGTTGD